MTEASDDLWHCIAGKGEECELVDEKPVAAIRLLLDFYSPFMAYSKTLDMVQAFYEVKKEKEAITDVHKV